MEYVCVCIPLITTIMMVTMIPDIRLSLCCCHFFFNRPHALWCTSWHSCLSKGAFLTFLVCCCRTSLGSSLPSVSSLSFSMGLFGNKSLLYAIRLGLLLLSKRNSSSFVITFPPPISCRMILFVQAICVYKQERQTLLLHLYPCGVLLYGAKGLQTKVPNVHDGGKTRGTSEICARKKAGKLIPVMRFLEFLE